MLWEIEIRPALQETDREGARVLAECQNFGATSILDVRSARSFLLQGEIEPATIERLAPSLLVDSVVESYSLGRLDSKTPANQTSDSHPEGSGQTVNVLFRPGVTDNVASSAKEALARMGLDFEAVSTCRKYFFNADADPAELRRVTAKILANDAIEHALFGPLALDEISVGGTYEFQLLTVPLRQMDDPALASLSKTGQLYLSLVEMQTIQRHFQELGRDPTDIELETVAQTWSEHCSHKTLGGRIRYRDDHREIQFESMLKETIFAATTKIRQRLGADDWCVSVFKDNAGIVRFDDKQNVCIKVETHNHPSAIEPYGGANTGLGGVIRDPLGTGLGARPVCNTDVFCFAPPDTPADSLPPGTLHPRVVAKGVVAGVRDYGNRMGIPTVNGAIVFDPRYLGNPLVYCGNVAMIPRDKCEKHQKAGDLIVAVGGRTGRDGIHGATFSSAELTEESETISGGAVQIGNAVMEKMVADVILEARDRNLFSAITDCGAGGFSSAVGEMGEEIGAEVWLERAPLKYSGLSYAEIWISEAQERMVLAVPPECWEEFETLCRSEGVEATVLGEFCDTGRLKLTYHGHEVGNLSMEFLHGGRPPIIREAVYSPPEMQPCEIPTRETYDEDLKNILGSLSVCSKEWVIRQYDHEVQAGSVVKPLVGVRGDGPSDAAVVRPDLHSLRGLAVACGINPGFGDLDPYWMAASVMDEAIRNCVAVGADPARIAILDNFCWGNTDRPETLGTLVRAALACHDFALIYGTPFVSGKDSLNNEFSYVDADGNKQTVAIPPSLLVTALGQLEDIHQAVTMDLKEVGNRLYQIGLTRNELGGSHFTLVNKLAGGDVPRVDGETAPKIFTALHEAIRAGLVRSCHDLSEGGLAAAVAEMSFAGEIGVEVSLEQLAQSTGLSDPAVLLFSESNTRFVVEVSAARANEFEAKFAGLPCERIGETAAHDRVVIRAASNQPPVIDSPWSELKQSWQAPLAWE